MKTATITDFRQKMKEHLNEIQEAQDILVLTGPKKKDFVVLTLETFNAMEENCTFIIYLGQYKALDGKHCAGQSTKYYKKRIEP